MKKSFDVRLRELRGSSSQCEFAHKIGARQTTYSSWERGIKEPSFDKLVFLSRQFGVTTDWLLGLADDRAGHSAPATDAVAAKRIAELEGEVAKLRAANDALQEAFANVGRGATTVSARRIGRAGV